MVRLRFALEPMGGGAGSPSLQVQPRPSHLKHDLGWCLMRSTGAPNLNGNPGIEAPGL